MGNVIVRLASEHDVPAITEIYNYEVLNGWATFDLEPKTVEDRVQWFHETRHPHSIMVAEDAGEVVGWGCLRAFHERQAYRFTAQNSVYVHQDHRGRGIGKLILASLIENGRENGFHSIMAGISQDNPVSDRLHKSFGFEFVGNEREVGYKFERWLDVTWWQLMLGDAPR
ncbi:MAG TPA: GNAT family N-acetyltransferase [Dehalococcoidia bacterium]|nr:GNAT family N-acetyltransferase [Dehalococcoidia bacterium]